MVEIGNDSGPAPEQPSGRDYSVGVAGLVSRTFSLWMRRLVSYVLIVGIVSVVMSAVSFVVLYALYGAAAFNLLELVFSDPLGLLVSIFSLTGLTDIVLLVVIVALSLVSILVGAVVGGGAIKFALQDYGNPGAGDVRSALSYGVSRAITLIAASFLQGLILAIPILPGLGIMLLSALAFDPADPSTWNSIALGGVVLLVGALVTLFLVVRLIPTIAVVVAEEEQSAFGAIKRAYQITGGAFWHTLGGVIIMAIAVFVVSLVLLVIVEAVAFVSPALALVGSLIVSLLLSPLNFIFQTVLYRDLESRAKEEEADWW